MESVERETLIAINDKDLEDGFFVISTSRRQDAVSIRRKVAPQYLRSYREITAGSGAIGWEFRIDRALLRGVALLIKKTAKRVATPAQIEAMAKMQEASKKNRTSS